MPSLPFRPVESVDCRKIRQIHYNFGDDAAVAAFDATESATDGYDAAESDTNDSDSANSLPMNPAPPQCLLVSCCEFRPTTLSMATDYLSCVFRPCDHLTGCLRILLSCLCVDYCCVRPSSSNSIVNPVPCRHSGWLLQTPRPSMKYRIGRMKAHLCWDEPRIWDWQHATSQHSSFGGDCNLLWHSDC